MNGCFSIRISQKCRPHEKKSPQSQSPENLAIFDWASRFFSMSELRRHSSANYWAGMCRVIVRARVGIHKRAAASGSRCTKFFEKKPPLHSAAQIHKKTPHNDATNKTQHHHNRHTRCGYELFHVCFAASFLTPKKITGKSSHAEQLAEATGLRHLSVNQVVKDKSCHEGWDDELKTWIVDEDKLLDEIEPQLEEGGNIIDWHVCEVFPERLIDLVVVLRVDSQLLYDRLKARYVFRLLFLLVARLSLMRRVQRLSRFVPTLPTIATPDDADWGLEKKLQENLDSEIMQVILEEARESYNEQIVIELRSDNADEIDTNVERISQWVKNWERDHPEGV
jgi:adenylate kinase